MKTAVSLPDELFSSADSLARELEISRSQLFARAIEEYLAKHRGQHVTDRLNEVLGAEDTSLEAAFRRSQGSSVQSNEW